MRRVTLALAGLVLALAGCTPPPSPPPTSATGFPKPFTVATTMVPTTLDPAAAVDDASAMFAHQFFQRLMTTGPGEQALKPDAAQDCLFKSETVYECRLRENLRFASGGPLTSASVKFSLLRALRLGIDRSTVSALSSLERIETPDPLVVRFVLKWPDTQFGFALTAPACSIVNEQLYDADAVRGSDVLPSGSGAYRLIRSGSDGYLMRTFTSYEGPQAGTVSPVLVATYKDSAAVEDAMKKGEVEYVWRGLSNAATKRLTRNAKAHEGRTETGFGPVFLTGTRIQLLRWNPASPSRLDATLRTAVAAALQDSRTLDSLVPPDAPEHVAAFLLGGSASMPPASGTRQRLTLGYRASIPDESDMARDLRDQLETQAGVSVQLLPDDPGADLQLGDTRAWAQTPLAWLQPYLSAPAPGSVPKVAELDQRWRGTTEKDARLAALSEIQKQAAADLVVLPVSQDDEVAWVADGYSLVGPRFGPGFQLSLASIKKG